MKTFLKKIKLYFIRLFRALLNKPTKEVVLLTKRELLFSFLKKNKNRIKEIMTYSSDVSNANVQEFRNIYESQTLKNNLEVFKLQETHPIKDELSH